MASFHWAWVCAGINLEAVHFDERGGAAGAQLHAPVAENVQHGGALGDADGVVVLRRQQGHGVADADALGALGDGAVEHLGRGTVGELPQEVVFHRPEVLEADLVGQVHLGQHLLVALRLDAGVMGFEESGFHTSGQISCVNPRIGTFRGILAYGVKIARRRMPCYVTRTRNRGGAKCGNR